MTFVFVFSSVHMEEASAVMQGAQGMLVQNWPTVSSAAGKAHFKDTCTLTTVIKS